MASKPRASRRSAQKGDVWRLRSRSEVLDEVRRLGKAGTFSSNRIPQSLHHAILKHWPSLQAARREAQLPELPRGKWTRETVLEALRAVDRAGVKMSQRGIIDSGASFGGAGLVAAALTTFGSFAKARAAAGIEAPPKPRGGGRIRWDAPLVISEIRRRHREGETLAMGKVRGSLVTTARRFFGTWEEAIEAAGFRYDDIRLARQYSDEELLARLRQTAAENPLWNRARLKRSRSLLVKRFGSIDAALKKAGIDNWPRTDIRRYLTRDEVIARLQARAATDSDMSTAALAKDELPLYASILRRFDSVWDAFRAAGLPFDNAPHSWTPDRILETLRTRHSLGQSLTAKDLAREVSTGLQSAIARVFGGLPQACREAGVPYQDGRRLKVSSEIAGKATMRGASSPPDT